MALEKLYMFESTWDGACLLWRIVLKTLADKTLKFFERNYVVQLRNLNNGARWKTGEHLRNNKYYLRSIPHKATGVVIECSPSLSTYS